MESLSLNLTLKLQTQEKKISIAAQDRLALVGPSGCGKSSLVRLLVGISDQGSGSFTVGSTELMNLKPWEKRIGYTPQELTLLPHLSVKQNLLFPVGAHLDPQVIEGLGISHLLDRMPRHLSGGEKQRVALARSLSGSPRLLILDDPFSSLDVSSKEKVVRFIDSYCRLRELPVIFISHDAQEIDDLGCEVLTFS